jgi:methionyl-tRNA formyltransferase
MTLNKILFFGNERLASGISTGAPTLRALAQAGYEITGVVIAQSEFGASRKVRETEIVQVAKEYGIRLFAPAQLREITAELATCQASVGVLVAYGKIVPRAIIEIFPRGIVNIHPSLLPLHRGPTPIESTILNGDRQTGVTLMRLDVGMDSGPVYAQQIVPVDGTETKAALTDKLLRLGKNMLLENLPSILDGSLDPAPQDDSQATYDTLLTKELSPLDWHKPAERLTREVRAYAGWPRSTAVVNNVELIVTAAHVADGQGEPGNVVDSRRELGVQTGDGVLIIDSLIPLGKREMSGQAFLSGYLRN